MTACLPSHVMSRPVFSGPASHIDSPLLSRASDEDKWKALKDWENDKDASEKCDVLKNIVCVHLKNKEKFLSGLEKPCLYPKPKKMCVGGYENIDKAI